jgi:hypothetical protein
MWNRDVTETFSVSSGLELSMLRTRALQSIPRAAHHRCSVLDHGRRITARSNLQVRDVVRGFDVHPLKIIQVTVGGRGGGKRKLDLDDSEVDRCHTPQCTGDKKRVCLSSVRYEPSGPSCPI